ncbi:MAG: hydantoinase/oxoprolinase [Acidobacteria bacterium]|nr:hydantoinase/oxoprolinase [Acidobacteriota bacterium]MCA1639062.1 hydantoinase/oxoprolinase [Acidobacteriota bacterium]
MRVGIDVGGTFTDVVVIDNDTREVVSQLKVPTTHSAREGVALGIINAIERVLNELEISPEDVIFIAHSTTQATNALLEGDVANVGVIGLGSGLEGWKAKFDTRVPPIELAPNRFLKPEYKFVSVSSDGLWNDNFTSHIIKELKNKGAEVIVASEAFGVDKNENENRIANLARAKGLLATSGHEVSTLYGLRTRTRTAVLNGAILPKMIHTATMTDECVKRAGIKAPLMIMRSDGGVMSVEEVHRRPIMTMLSGPAAGIAGALMYEKVSDGIFIEVGGTSADISVIRDGQPQTKAAKVGGHRTYLNTLDIRTLAIAGGSMVREKNGAIVDVGARSAHIAGLAYSSFQKPEIFESAKLIHLRPTEKDTDDYIAIETISGERFALTPTCAANLLGIIPETAFAFGNTEAARLAFKPLAEKLGISTEDAARKVLEISCAKVQKQIEELIAEYNLDRATVELVGGGGGAASLVTFTGKLMNLPARLARKAEVISTIGVALAMVRDVIERNIVDPTPEQILQVRREASESVIKIGALPETVEVNIEVDTRRNLVRATAFGTTELKQGESSTATDLEGCRQAAARSMKTDESNVRLKSETSALYVFTAEILRKTFFGLFNSSKQLARVVDKTGVVRLQRSHAEVYPTTVENIARELEFVITKLTDFGDAGRDLPDIHVLVGARIVNLSGLAEMEQVIALAQTELENLSADESVVVVAAPKNA